MFKFTMLEIGVEMKLYTILFYSLGFLCINIHGMYVEGYRRDFSLEQQLLDKTITPQQYLDLIKLNPLWGFGVYNKEEGLFSQAINFVKTFGDYNELIKKINATVTKYEQARNTIKAQLQTAEQKLSTIPNNVFYEISEYLVRQHSFIEEELRKKTYLGKLVTEGSSY